MFNLETTRLLLIFTPLKAVETRLRLESFQETLATDAGELLVDFPSEWPGDALVIFQMMLQQLQRAPETVPWSVILVDKFTRLAVGQMGFKSLPDETGMIEIGYGVNPSKQGFGYATEAVSKLVD
jgi:[ribosomal protein S5]-alanine N-acetyltransferase